MDLAEPIVIEDSIPFIKRTKEKIIKKVDVIKYEEKGSDVNIATEMLIDAFSDRYDIAILISK